MRSSRSGRINGGLFLDDEFIEVGPGTRFTPDHDQRNVASFALTYLARKYGMWTSFTGRLRAAFPWSFPILTPTSCTRFRAQNW